MKTITTWLVILAVALPVFAADKTITFDGVEYHLALSTQENPQMRVSQYVPEGQTVKRWTKMIATRHQERAVEAVNMAAVTAGVLAEISKEFPHAIFKNEEKGESMIDYVMWAQIDGENVMEHNLLRFKDAPDGGVIGYQFIEREYGDDIDGEAFIAHVTDGRARWIDELSKADWPAYVEYQK